MNWLNARRYWLPIVLAMLALLLLLRVLLADRFVLVPEDVDVIVLLVLLSAAIITAIHTVVRIAMSYLRLHTIQRLRRESLAEHRRFLSRLDHEFKNPLTALRAGLKTLALTQLDQQQREVVETLERETLRLNRLVTDLRKLGELETQPLDLQPVQVAAFVTEIVQLERDRFEATQRALTSRVEAEQAHWVFDEDLLALAVHNLLDNALKYTRPGDTIHLSISVRQELTLEVTDTGMGIPPAALPHIWEELYRAHPEEKIPGSGIGLALVKAIVERHDGLVEIASEPGAGTTIRLRLPGLSQL
jgi:two-component system, OmpR family, sensor kinase